MKRRMPRKSRSSRTPSPENHATEMIPNMHFGLTIGLSCLVAVFAVLPFLPVLQNGFVNLDDPVNFQQNHFFRGLGWENITWAWHTRLLGVYQPVSWILLELQYALFGLAPFGFHLTALALHAAASVLVFLIFWRLMVLAHPDADESSPRRFILSSATGAILFAVHPLRVEPIAWLSAQPYLTCAFFSFFRF